MSSMCSSLKNLPDISKWNITNVNNKSFMFYGITLSDFPDISKWNLTNVSNKEFMCSPYSSLSNLINKSI